MENGVEEELPVVKKINSLINAEMDAPYNLQSFLLFWESLFGVCPLKTVRKLKKERYH